jgi:hypothetical protein
MGLLSSFYGLSSQMHYSYEEHRRNVGLYGNIPSEAARDLRVDVVSILDAETV